MGGSPVVMFLSAGHCGTDRLAEAIAALYPDVAVAHEPVGPRYAPRRLPILSAARSRAERATTSTRDSRPSVRNVFQPGYATTWNGLSPYEKCLYWWTEVGMYGRELPGRIDGIPFLRVSAERIFGGDRAAVAKLLEFIGLPWHEAWLLARYDGEVDPEFDRVRGAT